MMIPRQHRHLLWALDVLSWFDQSQHRKVCKNDLDSAYGVK